MNDTQKSSPHLTLNRRAVDSVFRAVTTMEGAGVRLSRSLGSRQLDHLDPFLLLDEIKSEREEDTIAGFPWHPHRGIETVTYVLAGRVRHEDSLGNSDAIGPGDVQWMTAGRGIIHQEMPEMVDGHVWGFQLWVNLAARDKMCAPQYRDIHARDIPRGEIGPGVTAYVISGRHADLMGPVVDIAGSPLYMDISMAPSTDHLFEPIDARTVFAYVFEGGGSFVDAEGTHEATEKELVVFGSDGRMEARSGESGMRFLVVAGEPLNEPIVRYGPFVMNTQEQIEQAVSDYRNNRLLR